MNLPQARNISLADFVDKSAEYLRLLVGNRPEKILTAFWGAGVRIGFCRLHNLSKPRQSLVVYREQSVSISGWRFINTRPVFARVLGIFFIRVSAAATGQPLLPFHGHDVFWGQAELFGNEAPSCPLLNLLSRTAGDEGLEVNVRCQPVVHSSFSESSIYKVPPCAILRSAQ